MFFRAFPVHVVSLVRRRSLRSNAKSDDRWVNENWKRFNAALKIFISTVGSVPRQLWRGRTGVPARLRMC